MILQQDKLLHNISTLELQCLQPCALVFSQVAFLIVNFVQRTQEKVACSCKQSVGVDLGKISFIDLGKFV